MTRRNISSGSKWEPIIGYSRAVVAGNMVFVAGTAPSNPDGSAFAPGDPYAQTKRCLEIIEKALAEVGATMANVVRTRVFVTDISRWEEYGRAHGEYFGTIRPATAMIEVKGLIDPQMMVEVEADAVLP